MRKLSIILIAVAVVAVFSVSLFAEEKETAQQGMMDKGTMSEGMMHGSMMGKGMMQGAKMMDKGMMMRCMTGKEIVATQDGGVVILMGKKLMKYDKNLNLVKETEIKIDKEEWKMMMGDCPMWKGKDGMKESKEKEAEN